MTDDEQRRAPGPRLTCGDERGAPESAFGFAQDAAETEGSGEEPVGRPGPVDDDRGDAPPEESRAEPAVERGRHQEPAEDEHGRVNALDVGAPIARCHAGSGAAGAGSSCSVPLGATEPPIATATTNVIDTTDAISRNGQSWLRANSWPATADAMM